MDYSNLLLLPSQLDRLDDDLLLWHTLQHNALLLLLGLLLLNQDLLLGLLLNNDLLWLLLLKDDLLLLLLLLYDDLLLLLHRREYLASGRVYRDGVLLTTHGHALLRLLLLLDLIMH